MKRPYRKANDDEIWKIRQLKNQGLTLSQIGLEIRRNVEFVRQNALKHGIIKPRNIEDRLSNEGLQKFRELYLSGKYTNPEIGKMVGISQPSVKRLAKRLKLPNKYSPDHPIRIKIRKRVAALYREDKLSTKQISQILAKEFEFNISDERVRRDLKRMGINRRETNGLTKNRITRQNKIIKELYHAGTPLKDIEK